MLFIFKYWRLIAVGISVLSLLSTFLYLRHSYVQQGYTKCVVEFNEQSVRQKTIASKKIVKLEKEHEKAFQELIAKGDSGFGVGPVTSHVLDGMLDRASSTIR